jgi:GNAT superfamily N-acetyltransferase
MEFRWVDPSEWREVLALMREFYPFEGLVLDDAIAAQALRWVLADPKRGAIFLFQLDGETLGYCALTAGVSLEFGGPYLLLDELYLREEFRGRGLGREAMKFVENYAREAGYLALRLEVHDVNERAKELYRRRGFDDDRRWVFTKRLSLPSTA